MNTPASQLKNAVFFFLNRAAQMMNIEAVCLNPPDCRQV